MMSWTICRNLSGSASAPGRTDGDTGSELTFREYHELMGIYILIIFDYFVWNVWNVEYENDKAVTWDEDRSLASQQIRAPSVRMSSKAFNCPAFRKSRDIPRAHSCAKAWKLKAQPGDSEIPGESVPPMMSICLITTTCTGFFWSGKRRRHGSFL